MNLTRTAKVTQVAVKIFGILFVLYYIFTGIIIPLSGNFIEKLFPDKDKPTLAFGKLPLIKFDELKTENSVPVYTLTTRNGALPTGFPDKLKVYKYKSQSRSFQAQKNASSDALKLGFEDKDLASNVNSDLMRWFNSDSQANLQIQAQTKEIFMNMTYLDKAEYYKAGSVNEPVIKNIASQLFSRLNRANDPLYTNGYQTVVVGKFQNNKIVPTDLPFEMQIGKINYFRMIGPYTLYGPNIKEGLVYAIIGSPKDPSAVPNAKTVQFLQNPVIQYLYNEVDTESLATYPLLTVAQAWEQITKGKGHISNITSKDLSDFDVYRTIRVDRILINNVKLGYYDSKVAQKYLQPIWIFEGNYTTVGSGGNNDSGYIAIYLPAIKPENYITEQTTTNSTQ